MRSPSPPSEKVSIASLPSMIYSSQNIETPSASQLKQKVTLFKAGQIKQNISHWKELTSDKHILGIVSGFKIPFSKAPVQRKAPSEITFNDHEKRIISNELATLLEKRVIVPSKHKEGEFISTIFIRQKKDDISYRLILNLSRLNECIEYRHFKMENFATATSLVKEGCFFGSIDLKDAYYSIPIVAESQKMLKFFFGGKLSVHLPPERACMCAPNFHQTA